jgi:hypothetical protein
MDCIMSSTKNTILGRASPLTAPSGTGPQRRSDSCCGLLAMSSLLNIAPSIPDDVPRHSSSSGLLPCHLSGFSDPSLKSLSRPIALLSVPRPFNGLASCVLPRCNSLIPLFPLCFPLFRGITLRAPRMNGSDFRFQRRINQPGARQGSFLLELR